MPAVIKVRKNYSTRVDPELPVAGMAGSKNPIATEPRAVATGSNIQLELSSGFTSLELRARSLPLPVLTGC